eukprot:1861491-Pyramimonas_sp.AAC.1
MSPLCTHPSDFPAHGATREATNSHEQARRARHRGQQAVGRHPGVPTHPLHTPCTLPCTPRQTTDPTPPPLWRHYRSLGAAQVGPGLDLEAPADVL